jgi:hypothetical protein
MNFLKKINYEYFSPIIITIFGLVIVDNYIEKHSAKGIILWVTFLCCLSIAILSHTNQFLNYSINLICYLLFVGYLFYSYEINLTKSEIKQALLLPTFIVISIIFNLISNKTKQRPIFWGRSGAYRIRVIDIMYVITLVGLFFLWLTLC